jgi:tRNA-dihydrouridine synthase B
MKIGYLHIESPVFLAPLAGITDSVFRQLAKDHGAGMVYTEMISAQGLIHGGIKTFRLMEFTRRERPIGVQLFGSDPDAMARAAKMASGHKPNLIDINFGCPARKVVGHNGGSALLRDLGLLQRIVRSVTVATELPVTVKIRSGWDRNSLVAVEVAQLCAGCGAAAITVHPRTRRQGFSGQADWSLIAEVKKAVDIPVIGNGDIRRPEDGLRMVQETGCDAVMIGRGVLGHPWLLGQTADLLAGRSSRPDPTMEERIELCLRHAHQQVAAKGSYIGIRQMRKHFGWYTRGFPGAARLRQVLVTREHLADVESTFREYRRQRNTHALTPA